MADKDFVVIAHLSGSRTVEIPCSSIDLCRMEIQKMVSNGGITLNSSSSLMFYPMSTVQFVEASSRAEIEAKQVETQMLLADQEKKAIEDWLQTLPVEDVPQLIPPARPVHRPSLVKKEQKTAKKVA